MEKNQRGSYFRVFISTLLVCTVFLASGCLFRRPQQTPEEIAAKEAEAKAKLPVEHHVKYSGETLAIISKWYTGNAENWRIIKNANPSLKPERMYLGQKIIIPREIVAKSDPMPQSYLRSGAVSRGTKENSIAKGTAGDKKTLAEKGSAINVSQSAKLKESVKAVRSSKGQTVSDSIKEVEQSKISSSGASSVNAATQVTSSFDEEGMEKKTDDWTKEESDMEQSVDSLEVVKSRGTDVDESKTTVSTEFEDIEKITEVPDIDMKMGQEGAQVGISEDDKGAKSSASDDDKEREQLLEELLK